MVNWRLSSDSIFNHIITLLTAIDAIAGQHFTNISTGRYYRIPENNRLLTNLLIREVHMGRDNKKYLVYIGITQQKKVIDSTPAKNLCRWESGQRYDPDFHYQQITQVA